MKKILAFLVLSIFITSFISVSAQTNLDSDLYDENGFRIGQDITGDIEERVGPPEDLDRDTYLQQLRGEIPPANIDNFVVGEPATCFDYYTFGSIEINLTQDRNVYSPGDPVFIRGEIKNDNRFPITDLDIRARVVKDIPNPEYLRAEIITIEDMIIADNLILDAGESAEVKYSYQLPLNAPEGDYQILFYAYNNDRFNQSGLSFTNDIVASRISFAVGGNNPEHVYLDQTRISLNEKPHNVMAFLTSHSNDEDINITIPLVNPSNSSEEMKVIYKLYKWDGLLEKNIVDTKEEIVVLEAGEEVVLDYKVSKTDFSAYYLEIYADQSDSEKDKNVYDVSTQSNIRFSVIDNDYPRLNSFGVDKYPLKIGEEATLFTCFHNGADKNTDEVFLIDTKILDQNGEVISETKYEGELPSSIEAIVNKFAPRRDYSNFTIISTLSDSAGNIIDEVEQEYFCSDINEDYCIYSDRVDFSQILIILAVLIGLIIIFLVIKKTKKIEMVVITLVILGSVFIGGDSLEAASVSSGFNISQNASSGGAFSGYYNPSVNSYTTLNWTGTFDKVFNFVKGGINQNQNFSLSVGESASAVDQPTTGYWFISGSLYDSPPMDGVMYGRRYYNSEGTLEYYIYDAGEIFPHFAVSRPIERGNISITSSNPSVVSCDSSGCTGVSGGTATVTVSFNDREMSSYYGNKKLVYEVYDENMSDDQISDTQRRLRGESVIHDPNEYEEKIAPETCNKTIYYLFNDEGYEYCYGKSDLESGNVSLFNNRYLNPYTSSSAQLYLVKNRNENNNGFINYDNTGFGLVNIWESYHHWYSPEWIEETSYAFSFPDITYTVEVSGEGNQPQVSACSGAMNVTDTTATMVWTYNDPDGDQQTGYQVQVARDSAFTDIVKNESGITDQTSKIVQALSSNNTYYSRIRTNNEVNGWSDWSDCGSFNTEVFRGESYDVKCTVTPSTPLSVESGSATAQLSANLLLNGASIDLPVGEVFSWYRGSSSIADTDSPISETFTSVGSYSYEVRANAPNGDVVTDTCSVNVIDDTVVDPPPVGASGVFNIVPVLEPMCRVNISVIGAASCQIYKGGSLANTFFANAEGNVYENDVLLSNPQSGTYTAKCFDSSGTEIPLTLPSQRCFSNPDIIQQ